MVAIAPADAAEKLFIPVEYEFDVGGSSWASILASAKTWMQLNGSPHTCLRFNSLVENYEKTCIGCIS